MRDGSGFGKNVIIFGADMSSSVDIDNKKKDSKILGKCPTQGLNDTKFTTLMQRKNILWILVCSKICLIM